MQSSSEFLHNLPRWYAVHTRPRQEGRAESNLRAWRVETFAPWVKEPCPGLGSGEAGRRIKPLFPNYIFARFDADSMLHKVSFTRGVNCVVGFGAGPTPIDDEIIEVISAQVATDGCVRIGVELKQGDKVAISSGPFEGLTGIFERHTTEAERVMILLTAVEFQSHVVVERGLVRKINRVEGRRPPTEEPVKDNRRVPVRRAGVG